MEGESAEAHAGWTKKQRETTEAKIVWYGFGVERACMGDAIHLGSLRPRVQRVRIAAIDGFLRKRIVTATARLLIVAPY